MKRRLTKQDRAQCIWLLREAKKILLSKNQFLICTTLYRVYDENRGDNNLYLNYLYITGWVHKSLKGLYSYSDWIRVMHPKLHHSPLRVLVEQLYIARLAWIDWMINELEAGR
jgi:hypothetical protein